MRYCYLSSRANKIFLFIRCKMLLADAKRDFLTWVEVKTPNDAMRKTMRATFQRNLTYLPPHQNRYMFRQALIAEIQSLSDRYQTEVSDKEHGDLIVGMAEKLSGDYGHILQNGRLRIGTVQKALNLYQKMLWCLEADRQAPPHCPVDSIVLQSAGIGGKWTKMDSIETYHNWISRLRRHAEDAGCSSISEWELLLWNSTTNPKPLVSIRGSSSLPELPASHVQDTTTFPSVIPGEYVGHWIGQVRQYDRVKTYLGEIVLDSDSGYSRYHSQKPLFGKISIRTITPYYLEIDERFESGGRDGIITLSLNSSNELKCSWRVGVNSNKYCDAVMTRRQ